MAQDFVQVSLAALKNAQGEEYYGTIKIDQQTRQVNGKNVQNVSLQVLVGRNRGFIGWGVWEANIPVVMELLKNYNNQTGVVRVFNLHEEESNGKSYLKCSHMSFANFFEPKKNEAYRGIAEKIDAATTGESTEPASRENVPLHQHRYVDPAVTRTNAAPASAQPQQRKRPVIVAED